MRKDLKFDQRRFAFTDDVATATALRIFLGFEPGVTLTVPAVFLWNLGPAPLKSEYNSYHPVWRPRSRRRGQSLAGWWPSV